MPGADFRGTAGEEGKGIVIADGFASTAEEITFDPPTLAAGASAVSNEIPIAGVKLGDAIDIFPPYDTQGVIYHASSSSDGNIKISLYNAGSAEVDLPSGSWGISIRRRA